MIGMIKIDYIKGKITEKGSEFGNQLELVKKIVSRYNRKDDLKGRINFDFVISMGGECAPPRLPL